MRFLTLLFLVAAAPAHSACGTGTLVQICPPEPAAAPQADAEPTAPEAEPLVRKVLAPPERKVLKVPPRPPRYEVGTIFPTAEHSLLLNPQRYDLPPVDGPWRYYAVEGFVYRVAVADSTVLAAERTNNPALQR